MRTKLEIAHAHSMNNGICFYSKRHKNYIAIATTNEQGIIATEWTTIKKYKKYKSKQDKKAEMKRFVKFILIVFPFIDILLRLSMKLSTINLIYGIRTLLLGYSLIFLVTFIIYTRIERKQKKDLYKFHSAEHMVLNAYSKLKRVPTIKEIYQYSQFNNACGTNATTQVVISCILMFACSFIPNILYQLIAMLLVNIIVLILLKCGCLNFLQKFTTITPTNTELLVAIEGMNVWLENEKKEKEKSKFFKFLLRLFPRVFN